MASYLNAIRTRKGGPVATPQSQPIPGSRQVRNSAGGYGFAVDSWTRLHRWLILGSEGGSYYAGERALTAENADAVLDYLAEDGRRTVQEIVEVSRSGRAPKNDPALLALSLAASLGDLDTRRSALLALPQVARTGTHLFHFAAFCDGQRGWGKGLQRAIARWYNDREVSELVYQAIKYQQRDGWSHRDLLRKVHMQPATEAHDILYGWIVSGGWDWVGDDPHPIESLARLWAFEQIKRASSAEEVARWIADYRLPREAVPTRWLDEPVVWRALLEEMPMTAMIRNLAAMTRVGLLSRGSDAARIVVERLGDPARVRSARVHPVAVLSALKTYAQGRGVRSSGEWQPVGSVIAALDRAFYNAFDNVQPSGKRWLLAVDISGSMDCGTIAGVPGLTPRVAAAAMTLVTAAVEPQHSIVAFETILTPLGISPSMRLDDVVGAMQKLRMGGTDCALPMLWALERELPVDVFVVYTDSETWFGNIHPVQALRQYREKMGIDARLVVVGMVANGFSIADPNDAGMLDVAGFDTAAPQLIRDFGAGEL